jgi:hypothetical protein
MCRYRKTGADIRQCGAADIIDREKSGKIEEWEQIRKKCSGGYYGKSGKAV